MPKRLIYGVGVNDADYDVTIYVKDKKRYIQTWICPFYSKWASMIQRCYSELCQTKQPTYKGCTVVPEWHYFMNFRAWMIQQDWQGNDLDKDLLFPGNKVYGPATCLFVSNTVNSFMTEATKARGEWPMGVVYHNRAKRFMARCGNKHIGYFDTPEEAEQAYKEFKYKQAVILASMQADPRVAEALIDRYRFS